MSVTHLELYEQMDNQPTAFSRYNGGDEDDDDEEDGIPKIRIGICAMSKKVGVSQEALSVLFGQCPVAHGGSVLLFQLMNRDEHRERCL